ncbi:MAG: hypothetical protein KAT58_06030 [candidate division Zixibacteria bacterium]|nr:hypothetical protein [candidate division Zixibacteria bacterium]
MKIRRDNSKEKVPLILAPGTDRESLTNREGYRLALPCGSKATKTVRKARTATRRV